MPRIAGSDAVLVAPGDHHGKGATSPAARTAGISSDQHAIAGQTCDLTCQTARVLDRKAAPRKLRPNRSPWHRALLDSIRTTILCSLERSQATQLGAPDRAFTWLCW